MKRKNNKDGKVRFKNVWAITFSSVLVLYTSYTMLDTFVIPHDTVDASTVEISSIYDTDVTYSNADNDSSSSDETSSSEKENVFFQGNSFSQSSSSSSSDSGRSHGPGSHGHSRSSDRGSSQSRPSMGQNDSSSLASSGKSSSDSSAYSNSDNSSSNSSSVNSSSEDTLTSGSTSSDSITATVTNSGDSTTYTTSTGTVVTLTKTYVNDTYVYIADVQLSSIADLMSGVAENTFGRNITETTSDMAESLNALLAINGDYYGFRDSGYVMRNGYLYRSSVSSDDAEDFVIYEDGSAEVICEGDISAEELQENGALQIYSFGPGLIEDGEISVTTSTEVDKSMSTNPRTAIGYISPLHYVFIVSDGRTSESEGLTLYEMAEIMKSLGCTEAYNLDGGGSSTMYLDGEVVNNPTTNGNTIREREVSDIIYITS